MKNKQSLIPLYIITIIMFAALTTVDIFVVIPLLFFIIFVGYKILKIRKPKRRGKQNRRNIRKIKSKKVKNPIQKHPKVRNPIQKHHKVSEAEYEYYTKTLSDKHKDEHDVKESSNEHDIEESSNQHDMDEPFDDAFWNLNSDNHIELKMNKIYLAIKICTENNLASKAMLRRINIKIQQWGIENERDVDALMSDYQRLVSLIKDFTNK